jgi:hypothetical protein
MAIACRTLSGVRTLDTNVTSWRQAAATRGSVPGFCNGEHALNCCTCPIHAPLAANMSLANEFTSFMTLTPAGSARTACQQRRASSSGRIAVARPTSSSRQLSVVARWAPVVFADTLQRRAGSASELTRPAPPAAWHEAQLSCDGTRLYKDSTLRAVGHIAHPSTMTMQGGARQ